jgi:glutaredoxin-related protein
MRHLSQSRTLFGINSVPDIRVATQAEKSQMIKFKYVNIKLKKNNMKWNMPNISTTLFQKPSAITRLNG